VFSATENVRARSQPTVNSRVLATFPVNYPLDVIEQTRERDVVWYFIRTFLDGIPVEGWVRFDTVNGTSACPDLP
jgi:hypothetical protein